MMIKKKSNDEKKKGTSLKQQTQQRSNFRHDFGFGFVFGLELGHQYLANPKQRTHSYLFRTKCYLAFSFHEFPSILPERSVFGSMAYSVLFLFYFTFRFSFIFLFFVFLWIYAIWKGYSTMACTPFFLKITIRCTWPCGLLIVCSTSCKERNKRIKSLCLLNGKYQICLYSFLILFLLSCYGFYGIMLSVCHGGWHCVWILNSTFRFFFV